MVDMAQAIAFEEAWDGRLAGERTRPYREVLMFIVGRLLAAGAGPEDVTTYIEQCVDIFTPGHRRPAGAAS